MGRKSTSKGPQTPRPLTPPPTPSRKGLNPLVLGGVVVLAIAIGVVAFRAGGDTLADAPAASSTSDAAADAAKKGPEIPPEIVAKAAETARFGPRTQANLPPIPFHNAGTPRSPEVITAAYQFAAEHPEILSYVPCFCGCENAGHSGNHDCFVKARDAEGNVTAWDEHGTECAVCIDVANRSRQMHASGASVRDIRAAIEKEFASVYPGHTPTPDAPAPAVAHAH